MARTGAGTRRRTGWPTSSGGWSGSARPRRRWRPRRRSIRPIRTRTDQAHRRACGGTAGASGRGRRTAGPGAAQLHRPGQPHPADPRRLRAGYNGQIAVDAAHQIIVAHRLVTNSADYAPSCRSSTRPRPISAASSREVSGDCGFATEANLAAMTERGIRPIWRQAEHARRGPLPPAQALTKRPWMSAMAATLKRAGRGAATACESRWSSRCSGRSSRPEASGSSSCAASIRSEANGR